MLCVVNSVRVTFFWVRSVVAVVVVIETMHCGCMDVPWINGWKVVIKSWEREMLLSC